VPKFQANRLTMTTALLNAAAQVIFLVAGADKTPVLAEVLEGPRDDERLPSQRIQPAKGTLVWMIDAAAGAQLRQPLQQDH
jgi:6-phosphogluconolactonase